MSAVRSPNKDKETLASLEQGFSLDEEGLFLALSSKDCKKGGLHICITLEGARTSVSVVCTGAQGCVRE